MLIPGVFPVERDARQAFKLGLVAQAVPDRDHDVPGRSALGFVLPFRDTRHGAGCRSFREPLGLIRGLIIEIRKGVCIGYIEEVHRGHIIAAGGVNGVFVFSTFYILGVRIIAKNSVVVQCQRTVGVFDRDLTRRFAEFDHERIQIARVYARRLTRQRRIIDNHLPDCRRDQRIVRSGSDTVGIGIINRDLGRGCVTDYSNLCWLVRDFRCIISGVIIGV